MTNHSETAQRLNDVYRSQYAEAGCYSKSSQSWDERAKKGLLSGMQDGGYIQRFIPMLDLSDVKTVLDLGCGPGGIALALARLGLTVHAVDFSKEMLHALRTAADHAALNISLCCADWQDKRIELPVSDLVVASRCMDVPDLIPAVERLSSLARKRVVITFRSGVHMLDDSLLQQLGRHIPPAPSAALVKRLIRSMGYDVHMTLLEESEKSAHYASPSEWISRLEWSLGALTADEQTRALALYQRFPINEQGHAVYRHPKSWYVLTWQV